MGNIYDKASLILTGGSAYKAGELWAEKPLTDAGKFTYGRNSVANRLTDCGEVKEQAANVPLVEWLDSSPYMLYEIASTNRYTNSYSFSGWDFSQGSTVRTPNAGISPEGLINAAKIDQATNNNSCFFMQNTTVTAGYWYTHSIYVKSNGARYIQMTGSTGFNGSRINFDIIDGTVTYSDNYDAFLAYGIEAIGNDGWYRVFVTMVGGQSISGRIITALIDDANGGRLESCTVPTGGILAWGGQLEQWTSYEGLEPTSYIKTEGSTASRPRSDLYITSLQANNVFGESSGALYLNMRPRSSSRNTSARSVWMEDATDNGEAFQFYSTDSTAGGEFGTGTITWMWYNTHNGSTNGAEQISLNVDKDNKIVFSWTASQWKLYLNGTAVTTENHTSNPIKMNNFNFEPVQNCNAIKEIMFFDQQLTPEEAITLTTL
tara:strand:+ start:23 stop:1321 length:1299 start_codon:yes stop_codon:yes gene_type:complete